MASCSWTASRSSCTRPATPQARGIGIIYQELNLCSNLSVVDNIYLGRELVRGGRIDRGAQRDGARELIQRLGHDIDPDTPVSELRVGQQQIVEIAKALIQELRVLIMDEPTSALSTAEVDELFAVIRDLKASGVAVIYISHRLEETIEIGDYITVLRDGQLVEESPTAVVDVPWIVEKMVGRDPASMFQKQACADRRHPSERRGRVSAPQRGLRRRPRLVHTARRRGGRHLRADGGRPLGAVRVPRRAPSRRHRNDLARGPAARPGHRRRSDQGWHHPRSRGPPARRPRAAAVRRRQHAARLARQLRERQRRQSCVEPTATRLFGSRSTTWRYASLRPTR